MFSRPMFRYEYRAATRKRRPFVFRTAVGVVLAVVTALIGVLVYRAETDAEKVAMFGRAAFVTAFVVEILILVFFVPSFVGGAIAEERAKDTLPLLLLTRLSRPEIVLTKAAARWLSVLNIVLTGLPVLVATAWAAGLEREMVLAVVVLASSSAFMAALSVLASASCAQPGAARAQAMTWGFGWLIVPPFVSILPVRRADLWGMLLAEVKSLCALVAPSSPVSLVTSRGWYTGRGLDLETRVALMVGMQAAFGLLALAAAAGRLKARETNPNWTDPTRGHRPPCGEDPIYWREYELPMRRGGGSVFMIRLRYTWILIRAIAINAMTLLGILIALSVPVGTAFATAYYGVAAFQEFWAGGPFVERWRFNVLVRSVTGMLGVFPVMLQTSMVGTRLTAERDGKTWDALLATPLTGPEILRPKVRVALRLLASCWPLVLIWVLGVACGAVTALGVVLTAADFALFTWVLLAVSLNLNLRPIPTAVASSRTSVITLLLTLVHAALIAALLASPPELAAFGTWDWRWRWAVVLAGLAVMAATGAAARLLTRQTADRFDEWVGRPVRGAAKPPGGNPPVTESPAAFPETRAAEQYLDPV